MHDRILFVLSLLFVVFLLVMLAKRVKIAYPIFLVIAGLAISLVPGLPRLHLDPELVFLIFLPPLLYEAAWYTSWNDFWKWKRPIILLAFGLVFFTSSIVAWVTSSMIPGFTLALGFLLGGIVSPPDAVAATTVLKGMRVPKRLLAILEGESLVNDASSLIVFRFALAAVLTGTFSVQDASLQFVLVTGMGIVVGLAGAHILYVIHRFLPTTPAIDAALTVMTPYILFLAAEHFHFSGVMAVVSGGLFLSWRSHEVFRTGNTRLNMLGVWTTMIFVMNALVFILIGLALPEIIEGLGDYSIAEGIKYGLLVSALAIIVRIAWIYPTAFVPRWLSASVRRDPPPGWKGPLVIGWAGMRGVVSLATALSIPLYMANGSPFPHRNLIVFITFVVIFVTLVFQGLTLPFLIKLIRLREIDPIVRQEEQETGIQLNLDRVAFRYIKDHCSKRVEENELLALYKNGLERDIAANEQRLESLECDITEMDQIRSYRKALSEVYAEQRKELFRLRKYNLFSDEEIRKAELQLDLNDLKINGSGH
ncbi:Na+/H+ antiporter [Pararcticibacter amylolyticus]|uniref:Na+/H+ antiporter n=1 Tax=Pararcticibacter amylolyticus TaxID=2173175 RepID=A0A2U2PAB0_9SPHI|nr:Na+/H+ antiporter [Pararcticibacter amylolyticus]PWG78313.1 Na+/H+ antiporter [Pararcticibacter amylolyticus]